MFCGSRTSSVSSVMTGSPNVRGVAAARTYSHLGVMTPTPNARWLGLMRWTRKKISPLPQGSEPLLADFRLGWLVTNDIDTNRPSYRLLHLCDRLSDDGTKL